MDFNVIEGKREGSFLYYCGDGYYYHFHSQNYYSENEGNCEVAYLRCINKHKRGCQGASKVSIQEDGGYVWDNTQRHTCARDLTKVEVLKLKQHILKESTKRNNHYEPPSSLVHRCRDGVDPDVAGQVTVAEMKSSIQRARCKLYPPVPITLHNLARLLDDEANHRLLVTQDGKDSIYGGSVQRNGMASLIFVSRRMRRFLRRVKVVYCDGTFGSRPNQPGSAQILQIVAVVRNTAVPIVQVIMHSKSQDEYVAVLQHLQFLEPRFKPRLVMTDFESAMQNAWREVFDVKVVGCYWHYCRAVLRKAREIGLVPIMHGNRIIKSIVRSTCAIALLPTPLMENGIKTLIKEAADKGVLQELGEFFDYYVDTWMSPHALKSLSVYGIKYRTNNVAESCNRLLRSKTGAHRPNLWHFISALVRYEQEAYLTVRTLSMGLPGNRKRKVSAINNDNRIANFYEDLFSGVISLNKFLHKASTRVLNVFDEIIV